MPRSEAVTGSCWPDPFAPSQTLRAASNVQRGLAKSRRAQIFVYMLPSASCCESQILCLPLCSSPGLVVAGLAQTGAPVLMEKLLVLILQG